MAKCATSIRAVQTAIGHHGSLTYGGRQVIEAVAHKGGWDIHTRNESMQYEWRHIATAAGKQRLTAIAREANAADAATGRLMADGRDA